MNKITHDTPSIFITLAYLAINDPQMMVGMPPSLTAATGMDALTHSIEAFGFDTASMTEEQAAMAAILYIEELKKVIKIPSLSETASNPEDAIALAINAMGDTSMPENPRQPSIEEVIEVFYQAYVGE